MTFENIFNDKSERYTIVYGQLYTEIYGSQGNCDYELAEKLKKKLQAEEVNCCVISDVILKKTKADERNDNLILLGGTSVNKITKEIIPYLPRQYVSTGHYVGLYSRLSYEIYPGPKVALLQVIPNQPYRNYCWINLLTQIGYRGEYLTVWMNISRQEPT